MKEKVPEYLLTFHFSRSKPHPFLDDAFEFVDADADLLHGVAVAQGDGVVFQFSRVTNGLRWCLPTSQLRIATR